jgi:hypothetical protein
MIRRSVTSVSFWMALVLLAANGVAWVYVVAPEGPAVMVEPRLEPGVAELGQRLSDGGHSGEPFHLEITDQEAAETIAYFLDRNPDVPFRDVEVLIHPGGITANGVGELAGLRVGVVVQLRIALRDGLPVVTVQDLQLAGVGVPGFVRNRIQDELDTQFSAAQNLPLVIDELTLQDGQGTLRGTIR